MTMIPYCGAELEPELDVPPPSDDALARHALELENERLRQRVKSLQSVLDCAAKLVLPFHTPRQSARQR